MLSFAFTSTVRALTDLRIMRISTLLPLYSIFSLLGICFPEVYVYLEPWLDVFQSVALGIFYLLMLEFLAPSISRENMFFAPLAIPPSGSESPAESLSWYRVSPILPLPERDGC